MFVSVGCTVTTPAAMAKTAKKTAPAKAKRSVSQVIPPLSIKVVFGDKTTNFEITKSLSAAQVVLTDNYGAHQTKEISQRDHQFIYAQMQAIRGPTNQKIYCQRNYIEFRYNQKSMLGCLHSANKVSTQMRELANLLALMF